MVLYAVYVCLSVIVSAHQIWTNEHTQTRTHARTHTGVSVAGRVPVSCVRRLRVSQHLDASGR